MAPRTPNDLVFAAFDALPSGREAEILAFMLQVPGFSSQQRPDWIRLCPPAAHHRYLHLTARHAGGALCGYALVRLTPLLGGFTLASIRRGPVVVSLAQLGAVVRGFADILRGMGVCSLLLNPRFQGEAVVRAAVETLKAQGAILLPEARQSQHQATLLVDLSGDDAALRGRLKQRCRRQIRKAEKAGLTVRPAESLDAALSFEPLYISFHARRGLGIDTIPPIATLYEMTRQKGAFLLGHIGEELVCGHVVLPDGARALWATLASSETHVEVPKSYPLLWTALRLAQSQGFRWYDMAGAPTRGALAEGTVSEAARRRHQFKMAFAPIHVPLVPTMVLPIRRPAHAVLFGMRQAVSGIRRARRRAA